MTKRDSDTMIVCDRQLKLQNCLDEEVFVLFCNNYWEWFRMKLFPIDEAKITVASSSMINLVTLVNFLV